MHFSTHGIYIKCLKVYTEFTIAWFLNKMQHENSFCNKNGDAMNLTICYIVIKFATAIMMCLYLILM